MITIAEPKNRFKRNDGTEYPTWQKIVLGEHLSQYREITTVNNQYPVLTSSRIGLFLQQDYYGKQVASEDNIGYNIVPYGYFTYRHMSDDTIFHFNINYLVEKGIVSTLYPVFTTKNDIDDKFLQLYLNESSQFAKYCLLQKQGGSRTYMYYAKLEKFEGLFPCLEEQQKIATFFSSLNEAIAQSEAEVKALEKQKKGVMQKIFSQEVRFKKDDGTNYPEWEEKKIGKLIELYEKKVDSNCSLPILTSSKTKGIEYQSDHFGRDQLHDISGYNVLPRNYCTYRNRSDGTDFTFNINTLCDEGIVSKFYPVFKEKSCSLYFLMLLLNNEPITVKKIGCTAKGTGQKVLSIKDLQDISVHIPCLEEQQKIATFLTDMDTSIDLAKQELEKWKLLKKGLLQQMFA